VEAIKYICIYLKVVYIKSLKDLMTANLH